MRIVHTWLNASVTVCSMHVSTQLVRDVRKYVRFTTRKIMVRGCEAFHFPQIVRLLRSSRPYHLVHHQYEPHTTPMYTSHLHFPHQYAPRTTPMYTSHLHFRPPPPKSTGGPTYFIQPKKHDPSPLGTPLASLAASNVYLISFLI